MKIAPCDAQIYYIVVGTCNRIEIDQNHHRHYTKNELESLVHRLRIEVSYWEAYADTKKCKILNNCLEKISGMIAERVILEGE